MATNVSPHRVSLALDEETFRQLNLLANHQKVSRQAVIRAAIKRNFLDLPPALQVLSLPQALDFRSGRNEEEQSDGC